MDGLPLLAAANSLEGASRLAVLEDTFDCLHVLGMQFLDSLGGGHLRVVITSVDGTNKSGQTQKRSEEGDELHLVNFRLWDLFEYLLSLG